MSQGPVQVRLLGGFEVSLDGQPLGGFESQKVRALFSYLCIHRGRAFSREHLADLLWPEEDATAARRNLRQALYNLRRTLGSDDAGTPLLESSHQSVLLRPHRSLWLDVEEFDLHLQRSGEPERVDPHALAAAARLYRGDLLAGFHVDASEEFEQWRVTEQERLRERVLQALMRLMDHHLEAGTYSLGVEYGSRLVKLDPLSEVAHRRLIRLLAFAGRRNRAIAQYRELERLLDQELGVEPLEETTAEYRAILAEEVPGRAVRERADPAGPLVPMAGREAALERLDEIWREVVSGSGRATRVAGEAGIGKTRLIKTFLHQAASSQPALVLQGTFRSLAPAVPYQGVADALGAALVHEIEVAEALLQHLPHRELGRLEALLPSLRDLLPGHRPLAPEENDRPRLFEAVARALEVLGRELPFGASRAGAEDAAEACDPAPCPIVLFLDDVQAADPSSRSLLAFLRERLADRPVWLLEASTTPGPPAPGLETIELERLAPDAVAEIAEALVGRRSGDLAELLRRAGGLPLAITELINLLWDYGFLVENDGLWHFEGDPPPESVPETLEEIFGSRLISLPTSTRRLFTLAAIAVPEFDATLLAAAEREHEAVVETGLQVLLERWLTRLRLGYWADSRQERDLTLWSAGPSRGTFDISHPSLREIVYRRLDPERRAFLHGRIAEVLEGRGDDRPDGRWTEAIAHHYFLAGEWRRARPFLDRAAARAARLHAPATAAHYRSWHLWAEAEMGPPGEPLG